MGNDSRVTEEAMPLKIIETNGLSRPAFFCDYCGKEITDAKDGNYEWKGKDAATPAGAVIYFTHKKCCAPFEEANDGDWGAMELDCLPVYAVNNLKIDSPAKRPARLETNLKPSGAHAGTTWGMPAPARTSKRHAAVHRRETAAT
jgi:hypothetical protein